MVIIDSDLTCLDVVNGFLDAGKVIVVDSITLRCWLVNEGQKLSWMQEGRASGGVTSQGEYSELYSSHLIFDRGMRRFG